MGWGPGLRASSFPPRQPGRESALCTGECQAWRRKRHDCHRGLSGSGQSADPLITGNTLSGLRNACATPSMHLGPRRYYAVGVTPCGSGCAGGWVSPLAIQLSPAPSWPPPEAVRWRSFPFPPASPSGPLSGTFSCWRAPPASWMGWVGLWLRSPKPSDPVFSLIY